MADYRDVEDRIRRYAAAFSREANPPANLPASLMAGIGPRTRTNRLAGIPTFALASLAVLAGLGIGVGILQLRSLGHRPPPAVSHVTPTPGVTVTSSAPAPTPSASASPTCPGSTAAFKVVFGENSLSGARVLLYDSLTNATRVLVTLAGQQSSAVPAFISETRVSYLKQNATSVSIMVMNLPDGQVQTATTSQGIIVYAFSPNGTTLAYGTHDDATGRDRFWLKQDGAAPMALTPPMDSPGRGFSNYDERTVKFSASGQYVVLVDTLVGIGETGGGRLQVFDAASGSLIWTAPASDPPATMAVWSARANVLYFSDSTGVQYVDAGNPTELDTLASGLHWFYPYASSDGCSIAYGVLPSFIPHVEVRNLQSGAVTPVQPGSWRSHPVFVAANRLWYLEEKPSAIHPSQLTGVVFADDLGSQQESRLPFTDVYGIDVWPRQP